MKKILSIETSCSVLSVALGNTKGGIRELRAGKGFQHSEYLIPLIHQLLKKEKLSLDDIEVFAIDRGPGSFTGLRIGFSLLKGFLAVRKRPCYGALSLDMMTTPIDLPEGSVLCVLLDARRDALYGRFYKRQEREWTAVSNPKLFSLSEIKVQLKEETSVVGDALIRYREALSEDSRKRLHFLDESLLPSAATLVQWVQKNDPRLTPLKEPEDFTPLYFRASEAEEKRMRVIQHGA
ncbi:MAG: tRNA (adenosine(37)-N6)-threonylcarbamoyltransferase complex dimerization subunit type 1 TsaB [Candidatus Omnitrophica bacterium]|nr:tRNA (adenosine(37)-N6)-threonylcarbamoyltransferase complex dimerization subunit type 1 TsaB [Candidatus Omnitrophota bacterium]